MEQDTAETSFLQSHTGADLNAWIRRAKDFKDNPERRAAMIIKLRKYFESYLVKLAGKEKPVPTLQHIDKDESGLDTYHFGDDHVFFLGISLIPDSAIFEEIMTEQKQFTLRTAKNLRDEKPSRHSFVFTPTIADLYSNPEKPYLGVAQKGITLNPFSEPKNILHGGITIENGEFTIKKGQDLLESIPQSDHTEEVMFVLDSNNWPEASKIDNISHLKNDWTGMGYFEKNGEKRYFVIQSNNQFALEGIADGCIALDTVMKKENYDSWTLAGLDIGGGNALLTRHSDDGAIIRGAGLVTLNDYDFVDSGHSRDRFFTFSWNKH